MKKALSVMVLSLLCMALVVSCDDEASDMVTSLDISFEGSFGRTVMPSDQLLSVCKYSVSGQGPDGASFGPFVTTENRMSLQDIALGNWVITASALNAQGNELSTGSAVCNIVKGHNDLSLVLDRIPGSGTLEISFSWGSDICEGSTIDLVVGFEASDGVVTERTHEVRISDCSATMLFGLAAGSYVMTVNVKQGGTDLGLGATEAIRIVSNTKSSGSVVIRGKYETVSLSDNEIEAPQPAVTPGADLQISLDNRIGIPIGVFIDYSPKNPSAGQSIVLNAMYVSLPSGVAPADLFYQWYRDGEIVKLGYDSSLSTKAQSGIHRYDVVVRSTVEGTLSSATMVLNTP